MGYVAADWQTLLQTLYWLSYPMEATFGFPREAGKVRLAQSPVPLWRPVKTFSCLRRHCGNYPPSSVVIILHGPVGSYPAGTAKDSGYKATNVEVTWHTGVNMLPAWGSRVRDSMGWIFLIYQILLAAPGPGVYSTSNRNEYQKKKNNVSRE
jgi:hypothetical protein